MAALRHQLIVLRREVPVWVRLTNGVLQVITTIRPETLVRWHRAGFRCYLRWKSPSLGGQAQIEHLPLISLGGSLSSREAAEEK